MAASLVAASLVAASHIAARGERKGARDCPLKGRSLPDFGERGNVARYLGYQDTLFINVWMRGEDERRGEKDVVGPPSCGLLPYWGG